MTRRLFKHLALIIVLGGIGVGAADAEQRRSEAAKNHFKAVHPCPANGHNYGPCPGYVIDHITALACGGADAPENMQWQSEAEGKAKDKWERQGCTVAPAHRSAPVQSGADRNYYVGKRGGCFTYSASGKKRYVDHGYCGY